VAAKMGASVDVDKGSKGSGKGKGQGTAHGGRVTLFQRASEEPVKLAMLRNIYRLRCVFENLNHPYNPNNGHDAEHRPPQVCCGGGVYLRVVSPTAP
jgi:hypothetical protein